MNKSKLNDQELVCQYIQGHEQSLEILIHRHKNRVFSYIFLIIKEQSLAEDLFQETFIKVVQSLKRGKYYEDGKFLPWVLRIAHNIIIDYFRKQKITPLYRGNKNFDVFSILPQKDRNVEENIIFKQVCNEVKELVNYLPYNQKEVVIMRFYKKMSFSEIAEFTGVSINTALGRMRYALINLRKLMKSKQLNLSMV